MRENARVIYNKLILTTVLFAFWVAVTAVLTPADLVVGLVCSAVVAALAFYLLALDRRAGIPWRTILRFPFFALALAWEIIKANLDVALIIVSPSLPIDARVAEYRTCLQGDLARTVLADVLTLTPGTVTLQMEEERLLVHCLSARHEDKLRAGGLERLVAWLFGVKRDA